MFGDFYKTNLLNPTGIVTFQNNDSIVRFGSGDSLVPFM
jgi:hypothetical protein